MARVLTKFPGEALTFDFDFSARMVADDALASVDTTASSPSGLILGPAVINPAATQWPDMYSAPENSVAQMRISGGVAGQRYVIYVTCSTVAGDVVIGAGVLDVAA